MIITAVRIVDSDFPSIDFDENFNAIIGHTGARKTLLYKLIMFAFGVSVGLDFKSVISNFPSSTYIEVVIKDEKCQKSIKRQISETFHGFVDGEEIDNLKKYNSEINRLFDLNPVKVENGIKSCTFGFKELLNFIFIPEEQLSSNKSIFTREGFSEKEKIMNFFSYIVSGMTVGDDDTKERTKIKKDKNSVKSFQTALNRRVKKPSAEEIKKRDRIVDKLYVLNTEEKKLSEELQDLVTQRKQNLISLERINSLYKTYIANIEETRAGLSFEASVDKDSEPSDMDSLFLNSLENEISDLNETIQYSNSILKKINERITKINDRLKQLNEEEISLKEVLSTYAYIDSYETIQNASSRIFDAIEQTENEVKERIEEQQKTIDEAFKQNLYELCEAISLRLNNWGLHDVTVSFDYSNSDFRFNSERLSIVPKGLKSIYSLASAYEILKLAKKNEITNLNTVLVDSLWVATDIEGIVKEELISSIVSDLVDEETQIIVFENEIPLKERYGLQITNV